MNFSIEIAFNEEQFVLSTQRQIAKDFAKFNLFFEEMFESDPLSLDEILHLVQQNVASLMEEGETRLLQLLYTIDIPEKEFLKLITEPTFLQELSLQIIKREAYKVFLRKSFSS